jgi:hypothetical protein
VAVEARVDGGDVDIVCVGQDMLGEAEQRIAREIVGRPDDLARIGGR